MAEWGAEEDLIDFVTDFEKILWEEGVRLPKVQGQWIDVMLKAQSSS